MDTKIDVTNIALETDRLLLRAWKESDLDDFFEYARVPDVGEMAGWRHHESKDDTQKILESFIEEKTELAIVYKQNGRVIGSLGLHLSWANNNEQYKNLRQKEIEYVLSKDYWGMGLMPEAVNKVIKYCFETLKLEAITIGHFQSNKQSRRVIEKSGFTLVKSGQYYAKQLEQTFDDMQYILLADK